MKGQHDIVPRDALVYQHLGNPKVRAVMLDPHLAGLKVHVEEHVVYAPIALPADLAELVVSVLLITDQLSRNAALRGQHAIDFLKELLYNCAILSGSIHSNGSCAVAE